MKQKIVFLLALLFSILWLSPFNAQEHSSTLVISENAFSGSEIYQVSKDVSLELRKGIIVGVYVQKNVENREEWNSLLGTKYLPGNLNKTDITPLLWHKIRLEFDKADNSKTQVELLRPLWWLQQNNIVSGRTFFFNTSEVKAASTSKILAVSPTTADSRKLKPGQQIVIGTIHHQNATILDLTFQSEDEKANVGSTPNHRIFSKERNDWIPAENLKIGELVCTQTGVAALLQKTSRIKTFQVYNLEIHQNHNYYVSSLKILVHNNDDCNKSVSPEKMGSKKSRHYLQQTLLEIKDGSAISRGKFENRGNLIKPPPGGKTPIYEYYDVLKNGETRSDWRIVHDTANNSIRPVITC